MTGGLNRESGPDATTCGTDHPSSSTIGRVDPTQPRAGTDRDHRVAWRGEVTRRYCVPVLSEIIESPARGGDPTLPRGGTDHPSS
ncbi:MAG TPA: hypothetical protein VFD63_16650 [Pyrinomonadaceae bacterium]|nr:hypothetical protein [Pyrinomonadaceae bacterium]